VREGSSDELQFRREITPPCRACDTTCLARLQEILVPEILRERFIGTVPRPEVAHLASDRPGPRIRDLGKRDKVNQDVVFSGVPTAFLTLPSDVLQVSESGFGCPIPHRKISSGK
jgi:hypothetical protein